MLQTPSKTQQFSSTDFVESCGAILFDLSNPGDQKVCLSKLIDEDIWQLAKGRRNIGETRKDAAVREAYEETGYKCNLLPINMATRACAPDAPPDVRDVGRMYEAITEPFMCTLRELPNDNGVKIIWWFVAKLDAAVARGPGEDTFQSELFPFNEAIQKLHYDSDRKVLEKAIRLVEETLSGST